jgi:hypothetical protein
LSALPWTKNIDPVRRAVLTNMAFNMGVDGLLEFHNTLAAIQSARWDSAANGLLNSKAARQDALHVTNASQNNSRQESGSKWAYRPSLVAC